jgi:transcriptional regulator with XRE-family HTH domain
MSGLSVHERLRQSRVARGETLAIVAERAGVREGLLQAIEEGRFADLPRGIYGRSAIKSFAAALGLDAAQVLKECDAFLAPTDDPIDALARLRGVRTAAKTAAPPGPAPVQPAQWGESPAVWRPLAAAAIDGGIIMAMLLFLVAATMTFCGAPLSAFRGAASAFGVMGVLLAGCYFVWFAGIAGATLGERAMGIAAVAADPASHDLNSVITRTLRGVLRDVMSIRTLGDSLGRAANDWHTRMHSPSTPA